MARAKKSEERVGAAMTAVGEYPPGPAKEEGPFKVNLPELVPVARLNPAAYNPRKIAPEKFESLKESIRHDGFLDALVVQKTGMRIIGGHQRLKAVKEICVEGSRAAPDLPCIVLDIDDKSAKRLNIKLNKIQGEFESRLLGELLVDIYEQQPLDVLDFALLGFDALEAEKFIRLVEPDLIPLPAPEPEEPTSFGRSITLSVEFETVEQRDRVKELLMENAKTSKKKSGDIVAAALGIVKKSATKKSGG
jgi:ParB-like chromosome segregation protein Spo0J